MNGKKALVLVDIQRKFSESTEGLKETTRPMIPIVNGAIEAFREMGDPIVYVKFVGMEHEGSEPIENGDDFTDGLLRPREKDIVVYKGEMNSFKDSDLADVLSRTGAKDVIIAGMVAHYCVIATYYAAFDHGFTPYILKGGISSTRQDAIDAVENITKTISVEGIRNGEFGSYH